MPPPDPPPPQDASRSEAQGQRVLSFTVKLLRAFYKADVYAREGLGVRDPFGNRHKVTPPSAPLSSSFDRLSSSTTYAALPPRASAKARDRELLRRVYKTCVQAQVESLSTLLLGASREDKSTEERVAEALAMQDARVNVVDLVAALEAIEASFNAVSRSMSRSGSKHNDRCWRSDYKPDWKTRNLVWGLTQSMGRIVPPSVVAPRFRRVKEAVFTTMFPGDYISKQRVRASFTQTLLRHLPRPGALDARLGWLAMSFFVSIPIASTAYNVEHDVRQFWSSLAGVFSVTSVSMLLLYTKYTSWYATSLLDSVASRVPVETLIGFGYEDLAAAKEKSATPGGGDASTAGLVGGVRVEAVAGSPSKAAGSETRVSFDTSGDLSATPAPSHCPGQGFEEDGDDDSGSSLHLLQVSFLVERLTASAYFDHKCMLLGLSEAQVYAAIEMLLSTDSVLGRQFAAFSFTAIAISSRSVAKTGDATQSPYFAYGVFSMLSSAGFLCGLTSSILADMMRRQLSLTQTREENTGHIFAQKFATYIRLISGLNGFAGMFLATALFHFLLTIYLVPPFATLPLGLVWLIGGSISVESFLASNAYWSLSEVFDEIDDVVDMPTRLSPSPMTGIVQVISRILRCQLGGKGDKDD